MRGLSSPALVFSKLESRGRPTPREGRSLLLLVLLLVAVAAAGYMVARALPEGGSTGPPPLGKRSKGSRGGRADRGAVAVRAETVERGTLIRTVRLVGVLEPAARIELRPRTAGLVEELHFEVGQSVAPGTLMVQLDQEGPRQRLLQAEADLVASRALLHQSQSALQLAEAEWKRIQTLLAKGLVSDQQAETVQAEARKARSQVEVSAARIRQGEARVAEAEMNLGWTRVEAPIEGVVEVRDVELGSLVSAQNRLGTLVQLDPLKLLVKVPEKDLPRYRPGLRAQVSVDARPGTTYPAQVARVHPTADPATRLFTVELRVNNPKGALRPGMFARVRVELERREDVPILTRRAFVGGQPEGGVYVVAEGKVTHRAIRPGLLTPEGCEVLEGVQPGESVVVLGHHLLSEGSPVKVIAGEAETR